MISWGLAASVCSYATLRELRRTIADSDGTGRFEREGGEYATYTHSDPESGSRALARRLRCGDRQQWRRGRDEPRVLS